MTPHYVIATRHGEDLVSVDLRDRQFHDYDQALDALGQYKEQYPEDLANGFLILRIHGWGPRDA